METLTVKIPNGKSSDVSSYIEHMGGKVIKSPKKIDKEIEDEDEVTHEVFFGENIKRIIKAFSK